MVVLGRFPGGVSMARFPSVTSRVDDYTLGRPGLYQRVNFRCSVPRYGVPEIKRWCRKVSMPQECPERWPVYTPLFSAQVNC